MPQAVDRIERHPERGHSAEWEQLQLEPERDDQEEAEPERWRREERERRPGDEVVEPGVLLHRGEHADRDRQDEDREEHGAQQGDGGREALTDEAEHGLMP